MKLVGMLDSPYVRRVAISLQLLGIRFEHESLSVFRAFEQFQKVNPVVKAPSLVCDDGEVLMDSTLILEYAEALASPRVSLMPAGVAERQHALRLIGLALAACEKSVQIVYERWVRPPEKVHAPWVSRITGQMNAALAALEAELGRRPLAVTPESIGQAGVTTAVVWHFCRQLTPDCMEGSFPALQALSAQAEQLAAFKAAPHGSSTFRYDG